MGVVQQQGDRGQGRGGGRRLPIGVQTFREIRESGCYYVDKTPFIERLADGGKCFFLSRPRRFGKSLFVDTLKEAFEGNRKLFEGLVIHDSWDWSVCRPVLRLSFGGGIYGDRDGLRLNVLAQLDRVQRNTGVVSEYSTAPERFAHLLEQLHHSTGRRVVVLVDEYDKPILDVLDTPETAKANRDFLRGLYAAIKDADAHVRFVFLTGVSKFSKVSLFSGLNNLIDITLDPDYSTICGYTDGDLDTVFAAELEVLDRERIRRWYNGYNWCGPERVYNPFDVLLLFRNRRFGPYWFETGTPTFLVDLLIERGVSTPQLTRMTASERLLSVFDVGRIGTEALLFQTGYLTITAEIISGGRILYELDYPNLEVRMSLNDTLLAELVHDPVAAQTNTTRLIGLLDTNDIEGLHGLFHAFYASIPHQWYTRNDIDRFEGFYAAVFYSHFAASDLDIVVEDSTNHGRVDMTVHHNDRVYLFEFKIAGRSSPGPIPDRMRQRGYPDKYRHHARTVYLIGVEFDPDTRNITRFETTEIHASKPPQPE
ncbi:MAG: ATP-binding protein [Acidimicrobiaceae bacterium]|nr:ATP-binding protein [Acidimicrobiaceae bacterium]